MIASEKFFNDPMLMIRACWPHVKLYDKQVEILYSVRDNDETIVPAGNMLGKDFIAGLCALWFFCSRRPARVITSSAGGKQLESVLWGEIRNFIATSRYKLPIQINHLLLRHVDEEGRVEPKSYLRGIVTNEEENLQGHHLPQDIPRTLAIFDEASSIEDRFYKATDTWAHRKLVIGNPLECSNFFKRSVKAGDVSAPETRKSIDGKSSFFKKIIRIRAEDSPNVRLAMSQKKHGVDPNGRVLIPGVIDWWTYLKRRETWDEQSQCVGLDGDFYEGAEILLFPPIWLNIAEKIADQVKRFYRFGEAMGVDSAEGGDNTVWTVVDRFGILKQLSIRTHDTADIPGQTIQLIREFKVPPENVIFDRGGGGKQHADLLRRKGYNVRTLSFGEPVNPQRKRNGLYRSEKDIRATMEDRYTYKNRRAQIFGLLHNLLDPVYNPAGWGIPAQYSELRRQLTLIPKRFDPISGMLWLPPKKAKKGSKEPSLIDIIGNSPDESDSVSLAVFGMTFQSRAASLGIAT